MAISKRLKLRRSRNGGGGTRSVCPSLKSEGNCSGNAVCKWNATLSKCRKKRVVSTKSYSKKLSTDVTKQLSEEIKKGSWGDEPEAIKTGLWMLKKIKYNPLYKSEFTGETYEHRKNHAYLQARDKISAYSKYGGFYPDGNDKRLAVPDFS
jgi:hypothetical protein